MWIPRYTYFMVTEYLQSTYSMLCHEYLTLTSSLYAFAWISLKHLIFAWWLTYLTHLQEETEKRSQNFFFFALYLSAFLLFWFLLLICFFLRTSTKLLVAEFQCVWTVKWSVLYKFVCIYVKHSLFIPTCFIITLYFELVTLY